MDGETEDRGECRWLEPDCESQCEAVCSQPVIGRHVYFINDYHSDVDIYQIIIMGYLYRGQYTVKLDELLPSEINSTHFNILHRMQRLKIKGHLRIPVLV